MNIFVLDSNPVTAAIQQLDKHVVKMPLESAQMLCSALIAHGVEDTPYRKAHPKHPCTLWAAQTRTNFLWLVKHGISLSEEYTRRYGKRHKSQDVIEWCATQADAIPAGELTTFAQAMPEQYKNPDAVTAYRQYYMGEKRNIATWKQNRPAWFV
tara:strand:+ start:61 stop:522 length:462 start_codon:yes stop_codon:yes gene_type:complete